MHYHWRYNCSDNHIEETVEKIMDILKRKYVFNRARPPESGHKGFNQEADFSIAKL